MPPTGRRPNLELRRERQDAFLAAFAETGIASLAAKRAGIPGPQHYNWLRQDPHYAARFSELREQTRTSPNSTPSRAGRRAHTPGG